jgi:DNA-binding beta-propeller fold protein YncE
MINSAKIPLVIALITIAVAVQALTFAAPNSGHVAHVEQLFEQALGTRSVMAAPPGGDCNAQAADSIVNVAVPGNPFEAIPTPDGCALFVSLTRTPSAGDIGIAVLRRDSGHVQFSHVVPLQQSPRGMALTHDGKLLIVAADSAVVFLDVPRTLAGDSRAVVGEMREQHDVYRIMVSVTRDDHWLFASNEHDSSVAVIDLAKARRSGFAPSAVIGTIPVGIAPITVELSADERYVYTTSEQVRHSLGWPIRCKAEVGATSRNDPHAIGTVSVIDVELATRDPARAVVATASAACSPVRLVLSPSSDIAYVTARNSDALLAFDTRRLREDLGHALIDSVGVGSAPVGIALIDGGKRVVVANSNRFGGQTRNEELSVLDVSARARGGMRIVGQIPAGRFPRELRLTPDGRALLVTNFTSRTVELVRLTLTPH